MATGGVTDQVGGRRGHLCIPCNRAGRRTLATVVCKTCGGYLCNDCCVKHITSAIGKHDILNIGDQHQEEITAGIQHLDIDVEHASDFVDTFRDTRDATRPARLKHLMTLKLVKTDGDQEWPFVTGMDFLPDGRLAAVDEINCKCFILDDKLRRKGLYNFEYRPQDVSCYNGDNLAVTLTLTYVSRVLLYTIRIANLLASLRHHVKYQQLYKRTQNNIMFVIYMIISVWSCYYVIIGPACNNFVLVHVPSFHVHVYVLFFGNIYLDRHDLMTQWYNIYSNNSWQDKRHNIITCIHNSTKCHHTKHECTKIHHIRTHFKALFIFFL